MLDLARSIQNLTYTFAVPHLASPYLLMSPKAATADWIKQELTFDDKVKVAGFDVDGILRGR